MSKPLIQTIYNTYDDDQDTPEWEDVKEELTNFFDDGGTWILRGTNQCWNGTYGAGTIFTDFISMLATATKDCDYIHLYDQNGHFHLQCSHHDGTNHYEIKRLTDKGIAYLENWEENVSDTRSERYVHDQIIKHYSTLPHYARKMYGYAK